MFVFRFTKNGKFKRHICFVLILSMMFFFLCEGASTEVTARGVNALATWMIEHPLDDGTDELSTAGGVASPSELPTPPSPEMPALVAERCENLTVKTVKKVKRSIVFRN